MSTTDAVTFWEDVYAGRPAATDPRPNARLTETVTGRPPGVALDLGFGDGGDALWLARHAWHVTAVDIAAVAVERLAGLARSRGLGDRIVAERHDLQDSFPQGAYDLICAHYLQTPFALDRATVLRTAAHALRVGGHLLVVDHGSARRGRGTRMPTSGTRPHRRSPRIWTWTRRRGRSSGLTLRAGSRPGRVGRWPRSSTTSCSSAAPPDRRTPPPMQR